MIPQVRQLSQRSARHRPSLRSLKYSNGGVARGELAVRAPTRPRRRHSVFPAGSDGPPPRAPCLSDWDRIVFVSDGPAPA
jgi:hypothetical protein